MRYSWSFSPCSHQATLRCLLCTKSPACLSCITCLTVREVPAIWVLWFTLAYVYRLMDGHQVTGGKMFSMALLIVPATGYLRVGVGPRVVRNIVYGCAHLRVSNFNALPERYFKLVRISWPPTWRLFGMWPLVLHLPSDIESSHEPTGTTLDVQRILCQERKCPHANDTNNTFNFTTGVPCQLYC